jgi:acetyl-CoA acetyltransferase
MSQQHTRLQTMAEQLAALVLADREMSPNTRTALKDMANTLASEADIAHDNKMKRFEAQINALSPKQQPGFSVRSWWARLRS